MSLELEIFKEQTKCINDVQKPLIRLNYVLAILLFLSMALNAYFFTKQSNVLVKSNKNIDSIISQKVR